VRVLDLFSGIGGFSFGLERAGMETVAFCEIEDFPRRVLKKHWPEVPCYDDIRELSAERLESDGITDIDLLCGGYPCQPFSAAGKRRGAEDDRHLWPEYLRLIREIRPRWVIGENVAGHISMGLDTVLADLESEGYTTRTLVIPACAVNARHRRDRVWVLSSNSEYMRGTQQEREYKRPEVFNRGGFDGLDAGGDVADTASGQLPSGIDGCKFEGGEASTPAGQEQSGGRGGIQDAPNTKRRIEEQHGKAGRMGRIEESTAGDRGGQEATQSNLGRGVDGFSSWLDEPVNPPVGGDKTNRVARLKALGNAVVPAIPEMIGRAILEAEAWQSR